MSAECRNAYTPSLHRQAIINCINNYRAQMEEMLKNTDKTNDAAICRLQDILNEIPLCERIIEF